MTKISALSDIGTSVASNDTFVLVDVSDPTTPNKKIQQQNILAAGGLLPDGSAGTPGLRFLSDTDVGLFRPTTNTLAIATGGSERLRIDSSGRLGLGTSSVSEKLQLGGSSSQVIRIDGPGASAFIGTASSDIAQLSCNRSPLTGTRVDATRGSSLINLNGTTSGGSIELATSTGANDAIAAITIDSSQRVGIGTTSPGFPFQVKSTTNAHVAIWDNGGIPQVVGVNDANGSTELRLAGQVLSFTGNGGAGSEHARITSSGQLLVGTPSSYGVGSSAAAKLQTGDTSGGLAASFTSWSSFDDGGIIALGKAKGGSVGNYTILSDGDTVGQIRFAAADGTDLETNAALIKCQIDGTPGANDMPGRLVFSSTPSGSATPVERMRISSDGALRCFSANTVVRAFSATGAGGVEYLYGGYYSATDNLGTGSTLSFAVFTNGDTVNTNNSYGAISDIKLKENIVDANSQWDDLKALQVRNYNFKEGQTHTQIGLVAQEAELVSPGLVSESPDRDEDGNDLGTVTKSVNYSVLYMKAVKALQEAMERIEVLEAKVNALEGN